MSELLRVGSRFDATAGGATSDGRLRAQFREGEAWSFSSRGREMRWHRRGAKSAPTHVRDGRLEARDVDRSTDIVATSTDSSVEWFYVLRDASAPTEVHYDLELPSDVHVVRVDASSLRLDDADGSAWLTISAPRAIDARGVSVPVHLDANPGEIALRFDATGLSFPVLVDPGIVVPLAWKKETPPATPGGRSSVVLVRYGSTLLMPGRGSTTADTKTWEWNGTTWTQKATSVPWGSSTTALFSDMGTRTFAFRSPSSVYEWSGASWGSVTTAGTAPTGSLLAATANGGKVLLVVNGTTALETFTFDGSTWAKLGIPTLSKPSAAALFTRGTTAVLCTDKTYELEASGWVEKGTAPTGAYVGVGIGAYSLLVTSAGGPLGGPWAFNQWDGTSWSTLTSSPTLTYHEGAGFGVLGSKLVSYGGSTIISSSDETWTAGLAVSPGSKCTSGADCPSGNCADGVCCDTACTGTCKSCIGSKTGLADGTCGNVKIGTDPDDECAVLGVVPCITSGVCNGAGACDTKAGTACGVAACSGNVELPAAICQTDGTCGTPVGKDCAPYTCSGTKCLTSCAKDADCTAGNFCEVATGTCKTKTTIGAKCTSAAECPTGYCVDGVCCDTLCGAVCRACSHDKKGYGVDGVCEPIAAATDPDGECAATAPATCGTSGTCDGAGACALHPAGTSCGASTCVGGKTFGKVCDGAGACADEPGGVACFPYVLCGSATECASTCATDKQCVDGFFCDLDAAPSTCVPAHKNGASCKRPSECASGFCVDGTCCDSACTGQCESCGLAGKGGVCTATIGDPLPPRPSCKGEKGAPCAGTCDGANRATCSYPAEATICASSCSAGAEVTSVCNGDGSCKAGVPKSCGAYGCGTDRCATSCVTDADCASGNVCGTDGHCGATSDTCADAHTVRHTGTGGTTECDPFRCAAGACIEECTTSADCVDGATCNTTTKACVREAPTADEGGCAFGARAGGTGSTVLLLVAALATRRRRR